MAALRFTLRQMEIFTAVARSWSTSCAAQEIYLSQSAVSAALSELELTLGAQLFDRIGKKLILNAMGRALLARATGIVECARGIEMDFQSAHRASHLKIAASTTIANYLIPGLLAEHARQEPSSRVDVHVGNTSEVLRLVSNFSADAGVIEGPRNVPGLVMRHWRDDELVIVAAPGHPLAAGQRESGQPLDIA
ncbi:MAG TPA: LysR substrate-binding domain-containing protein, partial [Ramlibacter sp.]|nr:LysR substrate-binding domain-containing protein [Ramlibacter sp.]